ncbi:UNVERIFIED_ORG: magnesium-transporting ATPase (P-type) [Xanthobacter viscosus]|uniref:Uncharacterized protein n=1 Tax=Xanthobacter autotrophicus TaxID=280 RepID=A0A6C1KAC5_XANAU|nr:hypothetical protein [Xanthobacter autotrophicus]TLX41228.1 hypothetical protein FBQ73_20110 [Xanthobacter autotrophicus]
MSTFSDTTVIGRAYLISFLWVLGLFVALTSVSTIAHLVFFDFIHGNPNRSYQNVFVIIILMQPFLSIINIIFAILVFATPQALQAFLMKVLVHCFGKPARFCVLLTLPAIAIATWYCFDYFTLHDFSLGINAGLDWEPYQHGLTRSRYMVALMAQAPITLFSFLYVEVAARKLQTKWVVLTAFAIIISAGILIGYSESENQIRLQNECSQGDLC